MPSGSTYALRAPTGVYDVWLVGDDGSRPTEALFSVARSLALDADTALDVALPLHAVTGAVTVGGAEEASTGDLHFAIDATGEYAEARVAWGRYALELPDGRWTVTYVPDDADQVAEGTWSLGVVVVAGADISADLDVAAWPVEGTLALAVESRAAWLGDLIFLDADGGRWRQPIDGLAPWSTALPSGTYQVVVGDWVVGRDVAVDGPTTVDLVGEHFTVDGTFTIGGGPPPAGWTLRFVDPESGVGFAVSADAWSTEMHAAAYDVYALYQVGNSDVTVRVREGLVIAAPGEVAIDVPVATLSGPVRWDGVNPGDDTRVLLVDVASG